MTNQDLTLRTPHLHIHTMPFTACLKAKNSKMATPVSRRPVPVNATIFAESPVKTSPPMPLPMQAIPEIPMANTLMNRENRTAQTVIQRLRITMRAANPRGSHTGAPSTSSKTSQPLSRLEAFVFALTNLGSGVSIKIWDATYSGVPIAATASPSESPSSIRSSIISA